MHLVKFLKKVNFLSICIIMAFCFLLLLNSFVFGAVTLYHVQLFVSCAMIVTSVVVSIFTGLPMANPIEVCVLFVCFLFFLFFFLFLFFFSVSVKVLPVTPLVSGVFVHRAFCAYFLRIERVVELRRFLWWTQ